MVTLTELINKLTEIQSKYSEDGEGMVVFIDEDNIYYRDGFQFDLGNYNCEMGWEYLFKLK